MRGISRVLLFALSGCATTSNSAWLNEPEAGMSLGSELSASVAHADRPAYASDVGVERANVGERAADAPRRRLDRTVTLSGATVAAETRALADAPAAAPAPVQVTVNNYAAPPAYGGVYDDYYYSGARHFGGGPVEDRPQRVRPTAPNVQPGQDFPAPRSFGPAFPYKTAPASPWQ
jgi:hypothetical protein